MREVKREAGCGSAWLERLVWDQEAAGSNPVTPIKKRISTSGSVVEYRLAKARVAGSNPVSRSLKPLIFQGFLFLCCTACCSRECRKAQIFIFLEKTIDIFVIL